jgi:hypothetical protein
MFRPFHSAPYSDFLRSTLKLVPLLFCIKVYSPFSNYVPASYYLSLVCLAFIFGKTVCEGTTISSFWLAKMSRFRPSALFPFVSSAISFALILVLVLPGTNPNLIPDGYLLSVS